jgi:iron complex transport system substrate-binding protein
MTLKTIIHRALLAACAFSVFGCAAIPTDGERASTASSAQAQGETPKIAAMSWGTLELLDALGVEPAIVPAPPAADAVTRWPDALVKKYAQEKYAKLTTIAGRPSQDGPHPQAARLKALKPDIIITEVRARNNTDLQAIAPVMDLGLSNASLAESVVQNLLALGTKFGKERQASLRAQALLSDLRALRESAAKQGTGLVLFGVGNRIMPQQVNARFGMLYDIIGIRSALHPDDGAGLGQGVPPAPPAATDDPAAKAAAQAAQKARQQAEEKYLSDALAREPDWIFVVDRNAAFGPAKAAETMAATPAITRSKAWQQKKVIFLDHDGASWYLMTGSLGMLEKSIRQIRTAFDQHGTR